MEFEFSRLDHHGVVSGVIKDLGLIDETDRLSGVHDQSQISHGEAIAGMILNGLGFTDRPLSLSPQFFENKALGVLFREGVEASCFNRFKLRLRAPLWRTRGIGLSSRGRREPFWL